MKDLKELIKEADNYKEKRLAIPPLDLIKQKEMEDFFKLQIIYSSNALDNSTLTLSDTKLILENGLSLNGMPHKDYDEVIGHSAAYEFMLSLSKQKELDITRENIVRLHELLYEKSNPVIAGKLRDVSLTIKESNYTPPAPAELDHLMDHLADQLDSSKYALHPIELAALAHKRLLDIYPFLQGNGQVARLLMNLILSHAGYGYAIIPPDTRSQYVNALNTSRRLYNPDPITQVIAECIVNTNKEYFKIYELGCH